jgi:fibronectin-binding autotransporter adhesin
MNRNLESKNIVQRRALVTAAFASMLLVLGSLGATAAFGQTCANSMNDAWVGASTGNWSGASNWSAGEPSSTCDVFIQSGAAVTLDVNGSTANLTIGSGNSLTLPTITNASPSLTVTGSSLANSGQIILSVPVSFGTTNLLFSAGGGMVTLSGGGTVTLNANSFGGDGIGGSGAGATLLNEETIQGAGSVDLTFDNSSTGVINANESGFQLVVGRNNTNGPSTNTGLIEATSGGQLAMGSLTLSNVGGTIQAVGAGSSVSIEGEGQGGQTITGGTFATSSGGVINVDNSTIMDGTDGDTITNTGTMVLNDTGGNAGASFQGTISNSGSLQIESRGDAVTLNIPANQTLTVTGSGNVTMGDGTSNSYNNQNFISGGNGPATLVNESTIEGTGTIENGIAVTNSGTINANVPTGSNNLQLQITRLDTGAMTNTGTVEATNGGALILGAITLANAGGTVSASGAGSYVNTSGSSITGGTFTTSNGGTIYADQNGGTISTLTGITNTGAMVIQDNQAAALSGTVTNTGTITVDSSGDNTTLAIPVGQTLTLTGSGSVVLTNFSQSTVAATSCGSATLVNASTIQGSGIFFPNTNCFGTMTNSGTLLANQSVPLNIIALHFTNTGTLNVAAGSTMSFQGGASNFTNLVSGTLTNGTYLVTGTLQLQGNITTNQAKITLTGTSSQIENGSTNALAGFVTNGNKGSFTLAGDQIFTTSGSFTNEGIIKVSKGSTFTVGGSGSYTQTLGQTTVDGTLTTSSTGSFTGGSYFDTGSGSIKISKGLVFGNGGNLAASVMSSGTITPGDSATSVGALTVTGGYTQSSTGALDANIAGATTGKFGVLGVTSSASLNGTLNIKLLNNFVPAIGATFKILTASHVTGTFSTVNGTAINGSEHFQVTYNSNNVTLQVVAGT